MCTRNLALRRMKTVAKTSPDNGKINPVLVPTSLSLLLVESSASIDYIVPVNSSESLRG